MSLQTLLPRCQSKGNNQVKNPVGNQVTRNLFVVAPFTSYEEYQKQREAFAKTLVLFYKLYGKQLSVYYRSCREAYAEESFHTKVVMLAEVMKKSDIVLIDADGVDHEEENYGCMLLRMVAQDNNMPYATIKLPNIIAEFNLPDLADESNNSESEPEEIPAEAVETKEMLEYEWPERRRELWEAKQ